MPQSDSPHADSSSHSDGLPPPGTPEFFDHLSSATRFTVPATELLDAYFTLRDIGDERARLVLGQLLDESNGYIDIARKKVRQWLDGRGGKREEMELMSFVITEIVKGIHRDSGRDITAWVSFCVSRFKDACDSYEATFEEAAEISHPTTPESKEPLVERTAGDEAPWHFLDYAVDQAELKEFLRQEIPKLPDEFTRSVARAYFDFVFKGGPPPPVKGDETQDADALTMQFPDKSIDQIKHALYRKVKVQLKAAWKAQQNSP